jgi:hypothetical protein
MYITAATVPSDSGSVCCFYKKTGPVLFVCFCAALPCTHSPIASRLGTRHCGSSCGLQNPALAFRLSSLRQMTGGAVGGGGGGTHHQKLGAHIPQQMTGLLRVSRQRDLPATCAGDQTKHTPFCSALDRLDPALRAVRCALLPMSCVLFVLVVVVVTTCRLQVWVGVRKRDHGSSNSATATNSS